MNPQRELNVISCEQTQLGIGNIEEAVMVKVREERL